jgi:hypothetical protein
MRRLHELRKEPIPQLARGCLHTYATLKRVLGDIALAEVKCEFVPTGEFCDKLLVGIRFRATQLVIEMDDRKHDSQFAPQFQKKAEERDGVRAARNGYTHALAGMQQVVPPDGFQRFMRQFVHATIVQPESVRGRVTRLPGRRPSRGSLSGF